MMAISRNLELIRFLIEKDCKVKYRRTLLGALWSLIAPMLHYLVIGLVVSQFVPGSRTEYALLFLSGALPFALFSICCHRAPFVLLENQNLMRKAPLSKEIFIFQYVTFEWLQSLGVFFILITLACAFQWLHPSLTWLWIFPVYLFGGLMLMGICSMLSVLSVFVRDTGYLMPVLLQTLFFISPVAYSLGQAPLALRPLLQLNPITSLIESVRQPLLYQSVPWPQFATLALWSLALFAAGRWLLKTFDHEILMRV